VTTGNRETRPALDRRTAVATLLAGRGEALLVTGLGAPTWDAAAAGDHPGNFYLWGAMGGAAMVGLGLALTQPSRRVVVLTGDGEMLMGLGAIATVGVQAPRNLAIVVIDNERYGETGGQASHTGLGVDLAGVAAASSFASAATIRTDGELRSWVPRCYLEAGPLFAVVKVAAKPSPMALPPRDGAYLKHRFREHLLGDGVHR
jgi:thiamine pyrophosphate-dependent acetolactate synthase large subunit-like protein